MAETEATKRGRELRSTLMGETFVNTMNQSVYDDPIMQKFRDVTTENIFGNLWTRPGLDLKTRTLVCVVSDTATGRAPELELHLRMARRQGWTEEELTEVLLHLTGYIGAPLVREACLVARQVFAELRKEG